MEENEKDEGEDGLLTRTPSWRVKKKTATENNCPIGFVLLLFVRLVALPSMFYVDYRQTPSKNTDASEACSSESEQLTPKLATFLSYCTCVV